MLFPLIIARWLFGQYFWLWEAFYYESLVAGLWRCNSELVVRVNFEMASNTFFCSLFFFSTYSCCSSLQFCLQKDIWFNWGFFYAGRAIILFTLWSISLRFIVFDVPVDFNGTGCLLEVLVSSVMSTLCSLSSN